MEPSRVCTNCGGELDRVAPGAVLTTVKRLYCRRCREPEEGSLRAVLVSVSWWVVVLAAVFAVAWLLDARKPVQADENGAAVLQQLHEDIVAQARAQSIADGKPGAVPCFQIRRHGSTAICITLDEWKRQHAEDRTAMPEERVGMRL